MQKHNRYIAFDDNVLLFFSCAELEKIPYSPNTQKLINNLAIGEPLNYTAPALDCKLQT